MGSSRVRSTRGAAPLLAAAALTAVVGIVACSGDSSTAPRVVVGDAQIATDLATTAGDAITLDVTDMATSETAAGVDGSAGCPYDAATQYHVCSRVTERGLDVVRRYQFRDASGTPMQSYDAARTASIVFQRTVEGHTSTTTDAGVSWTEARHEQSERTVSGLAGPETQRVWNGTGTSADTASHIASGGSRTYAKTTSFAAVNVVEKLPRSSFRWPQSGTITRTVSAKLSTSGSGDVTRTVDRTAVVTFNGTSLVPITVGDLSCTLNLETAKLSGCNH